ncbi:hypothetical protein AB1Y20_006586 [Prymnesium parvum]|uniref:Gamma-butyrobetaine dioxygenase n=1 Tax=Prymnesium parvum TaxID=97485 RepID=A0AB34J0M9_PRYPA
MAVCRSGLLPAMPCASPIPLPNVLRTLPAAVPRARLATVPRKRTAPQPPAVMASGVVPALESKRTRLLSNSTAPGLRSAVVDAASGHLTLQWSDGLEASLHSLWLRDNCATRRHAATGQKLFSSAQLPAHLEMSVEQVTGSSVQLRWHGDGHVSEYCAHWLRGIIPTPAESAHSSTSSCVVPEFEFEDVRDCDPSTKLSWMQAIVSHGATLLRGVPQTEEAVQTVAEQLGPIQLQIYGKIFNVRSEPAAINLAYTCEAIGPHMDLCYYESPPGLQLLHCMRFDADVSGGESFLIDGFKVAEQLRRDEPAAFDSLSRLPATFIKDHADRPEPVLMSYRRPHFALNADGSLIGVFWSPPFEGPLQLPLHQVTEYYRAYRVLSNAIDTAPRWQYRMQPGDLIVFNNRRMLHGRNAFRSSTPHARSLRGCYVNIDEFANRFNVLRNRFGTLGSPEMNHFGNQDWGQGIIKLQRAPALPKG